MAASYLERSTKLASHSVATLNRLLPAKLLVRPLPYKGESLFSYVHRVGELNGLTSLNWAPTVLSKLVSFGVQSHLPMLLLAESVGIDPDLLSSMTCRPRSTALGHVVEFMNVDVPKKLFRRTRSAICAECLREREATPAVRDLRVICACVRHRKWLIDMCQECRCTLDWRREQLARCGCGSDLTRRIRNDIEPPESVLVFTKALEDWLRNDLPPAEERSRGFQRFMEDWLVADSIQLFQSAERYVRRYDGEQMTQLASTENHCFDIRAVLTISYMASGRRGLAQTEGR
ncbi:TniQ family protein [Cupriavidus sp. EM10]|uniref:TniQ family protein n=1 Tax=unclassified Cupriavidus TaxID=2640874 RepID=UPI001C004B8C|nr:TniQ family protein [Cupriavidus sp.]QWE94493.1 TniQ family protein [Cupriavidus sp. EM10]MCA3190696.1 TniQ family protein [Cupriavidus sp.]MCA3197400.1 TniQ family protein [Cupriavidus sp.]MCA3202677.1 TniQ family protein [Cupriavidus sp.]